MLKPLYAAMLVTHLLWFPRYGYAAPLDEIVSTTADQKG